MTTLIRPELSKKNKYWISKHRHYELKHFCLQYPEWKKACSTHSMKIASLITLETSLARFTPHNPSNVKASLIEYYTKQIDLIEKIAIETDHYLYDYLIKGITEGRSYTYLKAVLGMPCGRDMYYDRYRKFFWLLSNARG